MNNALTKWYMTGIFKGKNGDLALIFELYKKISLFWKLILLI